MIRKFIKFFSLSSYSCRNFKSTLTLLDHFFSSLSPYIFRSWMEVMVDMQVEGRMVLGRGPQTPDHRPVLSMAC